MAQPAVISRGETNAGKVRCFLSPSPRNRCAVRSSYRSRNLDRRESSTLFYARSTLLSFKPPPSLLNSLPKTFLLANEFRDFPSISHSSRATPPPPREISRSIERRIVRASSSLRRSKYYNSRRVRLTGDVYKRLLSILSIDSPFDRVVKFDVLERV